MTIVSTISQHFVRFIIVNVIIFNLVIIDIVANSLAKILMDTKREIKFKFRWYTLIIRDLRMRKLSIKRDPQ